MGLDGGFLANAISVNLFGLREDKSPGDIRDRPMGQWGQW